MINKTRTAFQSLFLFIHAKDEKKKEDAKDIFLFQICLNIFIVSCCNSCAGDRLHHFPVCVTDFLLYLLLWGLLGLVYSTKLYHFQIMPSRPRYNWQTPFSTGARFS